MRILVIYIYENILVIYFFIYISFFLYANHYMCVYLLAINVRMIIFLRSSYYMFSLRNPVQELFCYNFVWQNDYWIVPFLDSLGEHDFDSHWFMLQWFWIWHGKISAASPYSSPSASISIPNVHSRNSSGRPCRNYPLSKTEPPHHKSVRIKVMFSQTVQKWDNSRIILSNTVVTRWFSNGISKVQIWMKEYNLIFLHLIITK